MAWYVIVLIVSVALFVLSTIISLFFGDFNIEADIDLDSGFLLGDIISFKGLLHFAIGFSLVLTVMHEVTFTSICIGVVTGIIFVTVLYFLYKLVYEKLQQSMKYTNDIKEMDAEVYFWDNNQKTGEVFITLEGRPVTVTLECPDGIRFEKGQKIKVSGTRKLVYPIDFII
jgi:prepilin signal peptidase PulO-like enzyme (type II secretory pathway)